jgi:hypothetical protein
MKKIMGMDMFMDDLPMLMHMLMNEIDSKQKILVSKNFVHLSDFLDAMIF